MFDELVALETETGYVLPNSPTQTVGAEENYEQGIKRIHRTGQSKTCIYHIFKSDNYLDNGMWQSLNENGEYNEDMFEADSARINEIMEKEDDE